MLRSILFILSLCAAVPAAAQCGGSSFVERLTLRQSADLQALVDTIPYGAGNIWRVQKGDTTLTVLGTMHLPDPRHYHTFFRVQRALAAADLLLVEATLEDQSAIQIHMARNPELMTLPSNTSLAELLDTQTWDDVRAAAQARGLPGFMAAKMQPWFLSLTLAIPPCAMAAMTSGEGGLDNILIREAQNMDIPVIALEPWEDMFATLSAGTFDEQVDALRMGLIDPDVQESMVVALTDFYFAEQSAMGWYVSTYIKDYLPAVAAATFDQQLADLEQQLLIDRNANWIPVMEQVATEHGNVFIAFGAAHLFGESGVLRLLENRGWAITPF